MEWCGLFFFNDTATTEIYTLFPTRRSSDLGLGARAWRPSGPALRVKSVPVLPRLHAITDERIARRPDLSTVAQQLAVGGGENLAFHARGRALSGLEHFERSEERRGGKECRSRGS